MNKFDAYIKSKKDSSMLSDEKYMEMALEYAERAKSRGDMPVGSTLVCVESASPLQLCAGHTVNTSHILTEHAEMNVLRKACSMLTPRRVENGLLYSTLEPCAMCAAAAYECGIREIVFGAYDHHDGFISSTNRKLNTEAFGIRYRGGVLGKQCLSLLPDRVQGHCSVDGVI